MTSNNHSRRQFQPGPGGQQQALGPPNHHQYHHQTEYLLHYAGQVNPPVVQRNTDSG